jgi:hypothetical protein
MFVIFATDSQQAVVGNQFYVRDIVNVSPARAKGKSA